MDSKSIVSSLEPVLHLDIMTCKKEDLSFESDFTLKITRTDYCHALMAYFECAFTLVHKPIVFSTSPLSKYTHWCVRICDPRNQLFAFVRTDNFFFIYHFSFFSFILSILPIRNRHCLNYHCIANTITITTATIIATTTTTIIIIIIIIIITCYAIL